jgi:hypothetical protein
VVTDTLARVVEDDVHVERLLAGARASGVRYRRRRRLAVVAGAALSAAAVGTAVAVAGALLPTTGDPAAAPPVTTGAPSAPPSGAPASAATGAPPPRTTLPALPPAVGAPSAQSDPAQVGRPQLVHVSLDALPFPADVVQYLASADGERLEVQGRPDGTSRTMTMTMLTVRLARGTTDFEPLDGAQKSVSVNGRPGTFAHEARFGTGTLRWRLANGLWLQVRGQFEEAAALTVANSVRVDRTYRCITPFRLPSPPTGTRVDSCSMTFFAGPDRSTGLTVAISGFYVTITSDPGDGPTATEVNETLGGRPARVVEHPGDGGHQIMEILFSVGPSTTVSLTAEGSYDGSVVRGLAATLQWIGGSDPAAWPEDPVSGP